MLNQKSYEKATEEEKQKSSYLYWSSEIKQKIVTGRFVGIPIYMMQGQDQIEYLRRQKFENRRIFYKNAIHRKLKQYESVSWNEFGVANRKPKTPFNYWKKLFPDTYQLIV